jgi:hypothetical protein
MECSLSHGYQPSLSPPETSLSDDIQIEKDAKIESMADVT